MDAQKGRDDVMRVICGDSAWTDNRMGERVHSGPSGQLATIQEPAATVAMRKRISERCKLCMDTIKTRDFK